MLKSLSTLLPAVALAAAVAFVAPAHATETIKITISAGHPIIFPWIKHFHRVVDPGDQRRAGQDR